MNVFISADIEGTCGIADWRETERANGQDYAPFRQQMTREVAAACEGALAGGAQEIFVRDAHDSARNIDPNALPQCARIMRGWSGDLLTMMSGLDKQRYDAVFLTGFHAWAGSGGNPLSHTMNTRAERVLLCGSLASEFTICAYTAGYFGVPVALLTGDKALCDSARALIPAITTVAVNEGVGAATVSMHPALAEQTIRQAAQQAMGRAKACIVPMPERFETRVRMARHTRAYAKQFYPGAWLEEEKEVCFETDDWYEMLRFYHFVLDD